MASYQNFPACCPDDLEQKASVCSKLSTGFDKFESQEILTGLQIWRVKYS